MRSLSQRTGRRWVFAVSAIALALVLFSWISLVRRESREAADWRTLPRGGPLVLISVDTLRADHLSAYGEPEIGTPSLERLARDGVTFLAARSHVPLTLPSHATMFTGLLPYENGVRNNSGFALEGSKPHVVRELRDRGYGTAAFVSAFVLTAQTGIGSGFEHYDAQFGGGASKRTLGELQRAGAETVDASIEWLTKQPESRFFLFVHLYDPHTPYRPVPPYDRLYGKRSYGGEVSSSDAEVGRLLGQLRAQGLYDESLILVVSDHGEGLGDHGEEEHGIFLYREALDVPLVMKLPRSRYAGRLVTQPVGLVDVAATFRDWASLPVDHQSGRSLLRAVAAEATGQPVSRRSIYSETLYPRYHYGWKELYSLYDGGYSYVLAPGEELYDLSTDPGEQVNRLGWEARRREGMRSELEARVQEGGIAAPGEPSAEETRALEALGYVGAPTLVAGDGELPDPKERVGDLKSYLRALSLVAGGRYRDALPLLEKVLSRNKRMVDGWERLSHVRQRLGQLKLAMEAQRKSVELAPGRAPALLRMASLLTLLGRTDEAMRHAELAAKKMPGAAYLRLARLWAGRGEEEKALESAKKATQRRPAVLPFVRGLLAYQGRRFAEARREFDRAVSQVEARGGQSFSDLSFYLADCLARAASGASGAERGRLLEEAERRFRQELEDYPMNLPAALRLAALYMTLGRDSDRDRVLEAMAKQRPSPGTYRALAKAYRMFRLPEKAIHYEEKARAGGR